VAAPEGTTFQMLNGYGVQDLLMVCENGKLVTALFEKDSDEMPDALGIYDTVTGTWKQFTPERVDLANFHAVMDSGSHILLADAEGTAFLCDGNTGAVKSTFSMYLPFESISQLHLMEDDAFLLAVTEDSHFWIYDTATGEVVYREQMQTYDIYNNLTIVREQDGTRLYISWEDGGIVLEMDGWTKLAASPDIIGYDPYRDTIVSRIYDTWTWTDVLQFLQLPDTEGLVEIARGLLAQP